MGAFDDFALGTIFELLVGVRLHGLHNTTSFGTAGGLATLKSRTMRLPSLSSPISVRIFSHVLRIQLTVDLKTVRIVLIASPGLYGDIEEIVVAIEKLYLSYRLGVFRSRSYLPLRNKGSRASPVPPVPGVRPTVRWSSAHARR